jgi:exopolysaccharide biosynthesis WecB/TagA/CpsF family protein
MQNDREPLPLDADLVAPLTLTLSDCRLPEFVRIAEQFGSGEYGYVVTPNVDHVIRFFDDASFRELYRSASFVLLDSRFLARVLRMTTGARLPTCPGSDVTASLFSDVILPDDNVVLIGSSPDQAEVLRQRHQLRGLRHFNPPMGFINDPLAVEATLRFIEEQSPFRFCLLAVGCPQQEVLARALKARGRARGLALCIGASIDFITGGERRAPRWMGTLGLEWLFRLLQNPVRLAGRYLLRGPRIFFLLPRVRFQLQTTDADRS